MTGTELKQRRQREGLTQQTLADRIGWTIHSVRGWEQARTPIPRRAAMVIERHLPPLVVNPA